MTDFMLLHRKLLEPPGWNEKAACRSLPREWFIPPDGTLSSRSKELLRVGVNVCNTACPIREACLKHADPEDHKYTVRGGVFPTAISGRERGRPGYSGREERKPGYCVNGHHIETVGTREGGRCLQCRRDADERQRRRKGMTIRGPIEFAKSYRNGETICEGGHDITLDGVLTRTGFCLGCRSERKSEQRRKRAQVAAAKMEE